MKKYYPVDFDEKGKVILGNAKDTPTSNGFIPTAWVPGGSDEGNGIKSIEFPFETTPAIDTLVPITWEQGDVVPGAPDWVRGVKLQLYANTTMDSFPVRVTPAPNWVCLVDGEPGGNAGEPVEYNCTMLNQQTIYIMLPNAGASDPEKALQLDLLVNNRVD